MSFLHLSLLAGFAAIAAPIVLHLFGQRQPQLLDFPALRFVKETRQEQRSSWQLRHFLLLLLRILLFAALAFALMRPRVHSSSLDSIFWVSAIGVCAALASIIAAAAFVGKRPATVWLTSAIIALVLWSTAALWGVRSLTVGPPVPNPDTSSPIATAIILDNGPSMLYRSENRLRLDLAKERVNWILDQLPTESRVGLLGGAPVGSLALDPATAETQVKLVETRGGHVDLFSRLRTALDLVLASELERKEIYIVTDGMAVSWSSVQPGLKELLEDHKDEVLIQIIDIGDEDRANWWLGDITASAESVSAGGDIEFEVSVFRSPRSTDNKSVTIDLLKEEIDPRMPIIRNGELQTAPSKVVSRKVVELDQETSQTVRLSARNLDEGTHHFTIRFDKSDPLAIDNERYFSVVAHPPKPTLIISDDLDLAKTLRFLANPNRELSEELIASIPYSQIGQTELSQFALIWMHDPPPIPAISVEKLHQYAQKGGSVLCVLGSSLGTTSSAQGTTLNKLLPGSIDSIIVRPENRDNFLTPVALSHPMFQGIGESISAELWNPFGVYKNWSFKDLNENVQLVMQNSQDLSPAILNENVGRGQILTFTTPIPERESKDQWNELWISDEPILAFGLLRGALTALYGASEQSTNHQIGTPISLGNDETSQPTIYDLFWPNGEKRRFTASDGLLSLGSFERAGIYRLRGLRGDPVSRGFSINIPAADTTLERVEETVLEDQLGTDNFKIARTMDEVESSVGQARFGRELYPLLMLFVAGLFLAEQAMSNRFYKIKFSKPR